MDIAKAWEDYCNSPEGKAKLDALKEQMDNINPSGICVNCQFKCGKEHLLCSSCYANIFFYE